MADTDLPPPATEEQIAEIKRLLAERPGLQEAEDMRAELNEHAKQGGVSFRFAAHAIEFLSSYSARNRTKKEVEDEV